MLIKNITESKTNPRREEDFKGPAFDDLVASIKEKGVLMPILVRPVKGGHELVAGARRLRAARKAGLTEISAEVRTMTDDEAREAQIVENLQRKDVHPLEEASAYLTLIKTTADIKAVSAKVGKSAAYIQGRILLSNLVDESQKAYRAGEINDGHALEIARLSPGGDQQKALTHVREYTRYRKTYPVKELQRWIEDTFFNELAYQPWLKNKDAAAVVGACKECPPETSTLFGEAKEGACTTTRCHKRKMKKYLEWMKAQTPGLVLVSTEWNHGAGVLGEYDYKRVAKGTKGAKPALIVKGKGRGKLIQVRVTKEVVYAMTPEEKQKHEEEQTARRLADQKREAAELAQWNRKVEGTLKNITWPFKEKHLDPLFDILIERGDDAQEIAKRRNLEGKRDEDGDYEQVEKVLRAFFAKANVRTKAQLIVEAAAMMVWGQHEREKFMKKFG